MEKDGHEKSLKVGELTDRTESGRGIVDGGVRVHFTAPAEGV